MKIDGVEITLDHVGRDIRIIGEIDTYLPKGIITKISRVDGVDDTISVIDKKGQISWLSEDDAKNLSFKEKVPDLFTVDDKVTPLDIEGAYEHRKTVAKKIQKTFKVMAALKKELASAEYLHKVALREGDTLGLVIESNISSSKIKVSYQPEVIVFVGE